MNPYDLWLLIYHTHTIIDTKNNEANKETTEQRLNRARIKENPSLYMYKQYVNDCIASIAAVYGEVPYESRLAVKFINELDRKIYGKLQRELHNIVHLKWHDEFSKSLNDAGIKRQEQH
jgi:hypothetical protein